MCTGRHFHTFCLLACSPAYQLLTPVPCPLHSVRQVRNERGSAAAEKVIIILIALEIVVNAGFHIHALYY